MCSPHLCIEQSMMAGLKGATDSIRGRNVSNKNKFISVLSRPADVSIDTNKQR